jgi:hypothetical protein
MIAKYKADCHICGKPITPGVDEYDYASKKSVHLACKEKPESADRASRDAERLADELGFLPHREALEFPWSTVRFLPGGDRAGDSARGPDPAPTEQSTLWGMQASEESA